jgi:hypothetical protein
LKEGQCLEESEGEFWGACNVLFLDLEANSHGHAYFVKILAALLKSVYKLNVKQNKP